MSHYERLSPLDAAFLDIETHSCHMHVAATLIFDAKPVSLEHGGVDIDRIREHIAAAMRYVPRCQQRIDHIPLQRHPVWVDDDHFNIHFHVRHSALPRPGSIRQLKRLAARITSQKLDRTRPLWEMWIVEGLERDRFALIGKVHHCMIDGAAGVDIMAVLLRPDSSREVMKTAEWTPRPAPTRRALIANEVRRGTSRARSLLEGFGKLREDPHDALDRLKDAATGMLQTMGSGVKPAAKTPLNPHRISAYRRFDWLSTDLDRVKQIKRRFGGSLNDSVLTILSGAMRSFLQKRGVESAALEDFRVLMPVNIRSAKHQGALGNRISLILTELHLNQADPIERLRRIANLTQRAKKAQRQGAAGLVDGLTSWTATGVISQAMRVASRMRSYNMVVTNVPGPPVPLYLLGAQLLEAYPMVPLYLHQAVGIALFSYNGKIFWGLNADWDSVPDLHDLVIGLDDECNKLSDMAVTDDNTQSAG